MQSLYSVPKPATKDAERHTLIEQLQRKARKLKRLVGWWLLGTLVGVEVFVLCCWAFSGMPWLPYVAEGLFMSYFLICVAMGLTLLWDETGEQAIRLGDKRLVGTLIEMLDLTKFGVTVHSPLLRLLPTLQSGDSALLNETQRHRLNQVLMSRDVPLIVASLKALEQIGDKQALTFVQRLVVGEGGSAKSGQVLEAAQHCLPLLQARVAHTAASQTLLRATQAETTPDQTLLRAAHASQPTEAKQLLRASASDVVT